MNTQNTDQPSLVELAAFQQSCNAGAPQGYQQKFENGIEEIKAINETGLKGGDVAPDFELNNALSKPVKLSELLKQGPVVLSWYRGGWCPYCNIQLRHLQNYLPQFKALGASLIAIA
jgi:hypothetical protein